MDESISDSDLTLSKLRSLDQSERKALLRVKLKSNDALRRKLVGSAYKVQDWQIFHEVMMAWFEVGDFDPDSFKEGDFIEEPLVE